LRYEVHSIPNMFIAKEKGFIWPKTRFRVSLRRNLNY